MSETPAPRTRIRATSSKHRLFEASMKLIGERGHHNVTVDEIAAAAGVSKGTVYYNFGSKSELIGELLEYGTAILHERLVSGAALTDPRAGLETMVADALRFMEEYPSFAQLWISEQWQSPSIWADTLAVMRDEVLGVVRTAVERLPTTPGVDSGAMATALFGATLILGRDRHVFHPERGIGACVAAATAFIPR
ncbi:TetR/AcrR family transcriptional regulator [Paeniglutamicibacter cryotolerans]|uniref:AcrR family transcriptional regulator n=1 Tax=Paeniglutamicibacter cryotolerans TaxID=670079 RepID=A0A839QPY6_9MICC|nr:TetR/AcrR family transcriptional regulator [Paeniglutamicibacter cryotolerans]MBB2995312.1 AcrR family transcriptional regulator [Paeniglutamicibacter cryotolerans]